MLEIGSWRLTLPALVRINEIGVFVKGLNVHNQLQMVSDACYQFTALSS
jgi:hypothetical protein